MKQREIKFRIWDAESDEMRYTDEISVYDNGLMFHFDTHNDDKEPVIMQYTGLKDKKGKEIYEGDILEGDNSVQYLTMFYDASFLGKVIGLFNGDKTIGNIYPLGHFQLTSISVIGTLYENPELTPDPLT